MGGDTTGGETRARQLSVTGLFFLFCVTGIVVSLLLALTEASREDPYEVGEVSREQRGSTFTVTTEITNQQDEARCPLVHAAARDRETRDLADVPARPVGGAPADGRIEPDETVRYTATIDSLTEQEAREELEEFRFYVREDRPCQ